MNLKGIASIIILAILAAAFIGAIAYFGLVRNSTPATMQPPQATTATPPPSPVTTPITTAPGWDTYRNERYGFEFKYPNGWSIKDNPLRDYRGFGLFLLGNGNLPNPPLLSLRVGEKIEVYVGRRECVDRDSLRRQGFTVDYDPIKAGAALLSGPEIKETTVNGFTLGAFTIGCYECYGDTNERVKTDGVFAAACNSQATGCLVIQIEGPENDFESTKNLFVNQLFPTIKIAENFNTIQCIQNPGKG